MKDLGEEWVTEQQRTKAKNMADKKRQKFQEDMPADLVEPCVMIHSYTTEVLFEGVGRFMNNKDERKVRAKLEKGYHWYREIKRSTKKVQAEKPTWKFGPGYAYRGVKNFKYPDLKTKFQEGDLVPWYTMKSVTKHREIIEEDNFCGNE